MAALLNHGDLLEELKVNVSVTLADAYDRFVREVIGRSTLPRKILIQSAKGDFEIIANKGEIAGFRAFEAESSTWVQYPRLEAGERALEALALSADDAMKNGKISLSMVSDRERAELANWKAPADTVSDSNPSAPSDVVSLSDWKQGKNREKPMETIVNSPVLANFWASIKGKVKYTYLEDGTAGQDQTFGISGVVDEGLSKALKSSILKWREAVLPALGSGPQLLTMRSSSSDDSSLICVIDGSQFLLAEFETKNFGVVAGLWVKATQTKY